MTDLDRETAASETDVAPEAPHTDRSEHRRTLRRRYRRRRLTVVACLVAFLVASAVGLRLVLREEPAGQERLAASEPDPQVAAATTVSTTAPTTVAPSAPTAAPTTVPPSTVAPAAPPVPAGMTVGALVGGPGPIPVIHRIPTFDPVVFITIDDGVVADPAVLEIIRSRGVPITQFLTEQYVGVNGPGWYQQLQALGATVATHSVNHRDVTTLDEGSRQDQVCGVADRFAATFGVRPDLYRPPYGEWDQRTLQIAAGCGYKAVVHWSATYHAGLLSLQNGTALRGGDIILMHFKDNTAADLNQLLDVIAAAGLRPAALSDYVHAAPPPPPA